MDSPANKKPKLSFGVDQLMVRPLRESQRVNIVPPTVNAAPPAPKTPPAPAAPVPAPPINFCWPFPPAPLPMPSVFFTPPTPRLPLPAVPFTSGGTPPFPAPLNPALVAAALFHQLQQSAGNPMLFARRPQQQLPMTPVQWNANSTGGTTIQLPMFHQNPLLYTPNRMLGSAGTSTDASSSTGPSSTDTGVHGQQVPSTSTTAPVANETPATSRNAVARRKRNAPLAEDEAEGGGKAECEICHKKFHRPWLLNGHMRTHTGDKPYQCSSAECGRRFADRSNWRAHERTHGDEKPFGCPRCQKAFKLKSYLTKHVKSCGKP